MSTTTDTADGRPQIGNASMRIERFGDFLRLYYENEIAELAQHYPKEQRSLEIDYDDLYIFDDRLAQNVKERPRETKGEIESALADYDLPIDIEMQNADVIVRYSDESNHIGELQHHGRINELNGFTGQVTKVTPVQKHPKNIPFECLRCGTFNTIRQDSDELQEPHQCSGCERKGPFNQRLEEIPEHEMDDTQLARIQEPPDQTNGANGRSMDITLKNGLVDTVTPGDRVNGSAILTLEPAKQDSSNFNTALEAIHIEREEEDFEDVDTEAYEEDILALANGEHGDPFELLINSIATSHYGGEKIKLAIGLQLFGGVEKEQPDGTYQRGDSHILLLGDPGSGKSSFLQTVRNIAPRASYVSGKGASASGLTAAAVPDDFGDGKWSLEAGALVLADGGIACVDEIDKMKDDAKQSMHEALEAQEVHISKAGINARLSAKSALLAAGNPKEGRFDPYRPNGEQIALDPALVNRFDLLFMVDDQPDVSEDFAIAGHIIDRRTNAPDPAIDPDLLRAWVAYAKQRYRPKIDDSEAGEKIAEWYASIRQSGGGEDSPIPFNARNLQAVIRLSEASARARLSETVNNEDIERAKGLVQESLEQVGLDPETGKVDIDMIETGRSKSQRDRMVRVKDIIRENTPIPEEEAINKAKDAGFSKSKIEDALRDLSTKGHIYDLGDGAGLRWSGDSV